jgi:hypothetical protein
MSNSIKNWAKDFCLLFVTRWATVPHYKLSTVMICLTTHGPRSNGARWAQTETAIITFPLLWILSNKIAASKDKWMCTFDKYFPPKSDTSLHPHKQYKHVPVIHNLTNYMVRKIYTASFGPICWFGTVCFRRKFGHLKHQYLPMENFIFCCFNSYMIKFLEKTF